MNARSSRKRGLFLLGGGLLAVALAFAPGTLGGATTAWAAPPPETIGLDYVALGDSYAAGLGIASPTGDVPGCGQSTSSYPNLVATELGLDLTDVSCSGAATANIIDTAQSTASGPNPVQSSALSASTDIVTVTIGGNDLGFTAIIQQCLAMTKDGPLIFHTTITSCVDAYAPGGVDSLAAAIAGPVTAGLTGALAAIRTAAPNAKIFVVGYPALMPDAGNTPPGGCFTELDLAGHSFPFTDADVLYLNGVQTALDAATASAASAAGASYVSLLASTLGDTPCADNPDAFVNGVAAGVDAMHPNAAGAEFMADATEAAILAALEAPVITSGNPTPATLAGASYSFTATATGFPVPTFSVSAGTLPDNMTLNAATGEISGTPAAAGPSTFSIMASNSVGSTTAEYTIAVHDSPAITSAAPPSDATEGTHYSFTVGTSGFPLPEFAVASGALPDGITLNAITGEISGEPESAGSFTFSISATNVVGSATSSDYTIVVAAAATDTPDDGAPTVPTLVNTGADGLLPLGIAGGFVLLVGAGLLLARRRVQH